MYLAALSWSVDLAAKLPEPPVPDAPDIEHLLGLWSASKAVESWLPWNLPVLAGLRYDHSKVGGAGCAACGARPGEEPTVLATWAPAGAA